MDKSIYCKIRVKGHLDATWSDWFEGLTVSNEDGGEGLLSGRLPDQAALQGVLKRINDLGVALISVNTAPRDD